MSLRLDLDPVPLIQMAHPLQLLSQLLLLFSQLLSV